MTAPPASPTPPQHVSRSTAAQGEALESAVPKYFQVKSKLAEVLDALGEGDTLPTERELSERFGVARMTVRQAIRDLRLEGRLLKRGRSTVLAGPKLLQPLSLGSYTEGVRAQGLRPGRRLITFEQVTADPALAEKLRLAHGASVLHLERLLLADDERVGLESTYLPAARFPTLMAEFDPGTSLYAYLKAAGVVFAEADERIETVLATPREVRLIGTSPALPMLLLNRVTRDPDGNAIEHVRSLFRGDRFSFTTTLTPDPRHSPGPAGTQAPEPE